MGFDHTTLMQYVSIHTPVKGVTQLLGREQLWKQVSIHTPVKGVTLDGVCQCRSHVCFNPHTREGCDLLVVLIQDT